MNSGYTKGKHRHFETWWRNKDVEVAVYRKRELLGFGSTFGVRKI